MRILSYSKKTVALLLSLLVVLSSFTVLLVNVKADTNVVMAYQDPFTANGDYITADSGIAGTPIKQGFSMANSYTKGNYENRVYCLNMGNHPYSTSLDSSSSVWDQKANDGQKLEFKKSAISDIIALGLAGNMPGKVVKKFDKSNRTTSNKVITHNVYKTAKYSADGTTVRTYSDSEIYIATQLLIWEVTQGYRKIGSLNKSSKYLINAYNNTNIKTVYNYISNRIYYINKTPSFTVMADDDASMKVYNFKVTYNASTGKYSFSPSSRTITSSNYKYVLKYYPDLAKNKSIAFKDSAGNTKRLNITANINADGDKLTLTPKSVSSNVPDGYSSNPLAFSNEKELPTGSGDKKELNNCVIAYMPSKGQMKNGQCQVGINTDSCWIDPRKAYFKVTASYAVEGVDRDFTIQKDMRIKSETSASGVKSDNSSLDSMEEGYYYYVTLPDVAYNTASPLGEPYRYGYIKDGKVVASDPINSQDSEEVLSLSRKKDSSGNYKIYYNTKLQEFYTIVGPTDSEGETQSVAKSISNYVKSGINETNLPFGNYYIYELGKRTKNVDDNSKRAYMTPSNYAMPTGINSYYYTYQEHYNALVDGTSEHNIQYKDDNNKTVNYATLTLAVRQGIKAGSLEYYQRLKRIYRGATSSSSASPISINLTSVPIRIHKTADDGIVGKIAFKIEQYKNNEWISVDLSKYIDDTNYGNYGLDLAKGELVTYATSITTDGITRTKGYSPYLYLPAGNYKITELGKVNDLQSPSVILFREYNKRPEVITFNIGTDDKIIEDFVNNKEIEFDIDNSSSIQLRLFKEDNNGKRLNGAEFALYSDTGLQLTNSIKTATQEINGKSEDGVAIVDGLQLGTYTLKETKAPDGYILSDEKYTFTINSSDLLKGSTEKDGYYDFYNYTVTNTPTKIPFKKTDLNGKVLEGAKLRVYPNGSSSDVIDEWVSTKESHIIEGLVAGKTYVLEEVSPPAGYIKTGILFFKVDENGKAQYVGKPSDVDDVIMKDDTTKYSFNKVDEKGNSLNGAVLQIIDSEGKVVREWTTDGNDYVLDGVLTVGKTYTLHEKSAPSDDYELAKDITFTVKDTPERQVITMTDKYKRGSVTLHKTDSDGNPLSGAEFELYKADGTKVSVNNSSDGVYEVANSDTNTCVVNSNGTLKVDKLRLGNYYFIETKSPDGYMTNGKKISFSITGESEITLNVDLTVPNNKSFYPDTGGNGYVIPTTIAISIIILSAIGLIALKKKTKKKEK